jgi:hypothetical protein
MKPKTDKARIAALEKKTADLEQWCVNLNTAHSGLFHWAHYVGECLTKEIRPQLAGLRTAKEGLLPCPHCGGKAHSSARPCAKVRAKK